MLCIATRDESVEATVGVIVGKHDDTKGFKVYLPHEKLLVTTQYVKNTEDAAELKELQAIGRKVSRRGNRGRKGATTSNTTDNDDADHREEKRPRKRMTPRNMGAKGVPMAMARVIEDQIS